MEDEFEGMLDDAGRVHFHTECPQGHATIQAFTPEEWRAGLDADRLTFECLYCGERWRPTAVQRAAILGQVY